LRRLSNQLRRPAGDLRRQFDGLPSWRCGIKAAEGRRSPKRWRAAPEVRRTRSVLECASPLALSGGGAMGGLVGRLAALPHAAAAGVIFSRQNF
jgi:hypothetical protein